MTHSWTDPTDWFNWWLLACIVYVLWAVWLIGIAPILDERTRRKQHGL